MPRLDWLMACSENDPDTETLLDSSIQAFSLLASISKCTGFIATNSEIKKTQYNYN
jgi:hypothetical protein